MTSSSLSEKDRLNLLFLLDYFHEYNHEPNEPTDVRLRALLSCERFIQDGIEAEEFIKHDEQRKRLRQESLAKSTQQAINSEGEEDDSWEWDPVKKEVRLLDTRSKARAGMYKGKDEEDKVGPSAQKVEAH